MTQHLTLHNLQSKLLTAPSTQVRYELSRLSSVDEKNATEAAVLILVVGRGPVEQPHFSVVFTRRSKNLKKHSGQVSFPGGKLEANDKSAWHGAVREANEEIGLNPRAINKLGYLPRFLTGSGFIITPVVGYIYEPTPFVPSEAEVDVIFEIDLATLSKNAIYYEKSFVIDDLSFTSWTIAHESENIWGITAGLTRHLYELALKDLVWSR